MTRGKDEERERRLAEALRANLKRRKQQQRATGSNGPADDEQPDTQAERQA